MAIANANNATRAGGIDLFQVLEGKDGAKRFADLSLGCVELSYYEDVLSNSVSATAVIVESGLSDTEIGDKAGNNKGYVGILDNLPVRGGEQVNLVIKDNQVTPNGLKFFGGRELYVNRIRQINPGTQRDTYYLDLCTRESIANEQIRVVQRYNGRISDNVATILKKPLSGEGGLNTPKKVYLDPTDQTYNFIGNDRKPFYVCTWLAAKSIPVLNVDGKSSTGGAAGYLFYETYDGFAFKSIDVLNKQEPLKKYIFTNTPDLSEEYDAKILAVDIQRDVDLIQNLTMGAYANRTLFFDHVNYEYRVRDYKLSANQEGKVENTGRRSFGEGIASEIKDAPSRIMNRVLDIGTLPPGLTTSEQLKAWRGIASEIKDAPSRIMNRVLDIGTLPPGLTTSEQLKAWRENKLAPTYNSREIMAQSAMRYNQLFTIKINITIAGDFSLRAGDMIHCDFPQLSVDPAKERNKQTGGKYLIASVCHRLTPDDCYTSLTLVRDSFGRKPYTTATTSSTLDSRIADPLGLNGRFSYNL